MVEAEPVQALVEAFLDAAVVGAPQLCGDEEVGAGADALADGLGEGFAHFAFIAVHVGAVDVAVAGAEGVQDGGLGLARGRLPRAVAEERDGTAGVEREGSVWIGRGGACHCGLRHDSLLDAMSVR